MDDVYGTDTDFSLPNSSYSHSSFSLFDNNDCLTQQNQYLDVLSLNELGKLGVLSELLC